MIEQLAPYTPILMARAEELFGPRSPGWSMPTLFVGPKGPLTDCTSSPGNLIICLKFSGDFDLHQGIFQIAHEIVHCLDTAAIPPATMIEEGAAVWFSIHGPQYPWPGYKNAAIEHINTDKFAPNYADARLLYDELLSYDAEAVRKIRRHCRIDDVDPDILQKTIPEIPSDLAHRLCQRRPMRADYD